MNTYYVYLADGQHDFLGKINVKDADANNLDRLLAKARKAFRVVNIRVDSARRNLRPPTKPARVGPNVARKPTPEQYAYYGR